MAKGNLYRLWEVSGVFLFSSWELLQKRLPKFLLFILLLFFYKWKWLLEIPPPKRLRKGFETLGSAYLKIGQLLSTRIDLLPAPFIEELEKLQDRVPPDPLTNFKEEHPNLFSTLKEIEETPIGSGSVAQVHKATLKSGETVAVKFLRPKAEKLIKQDLTLLKRVIRVASLFIPVVKEFRLLSVLEEIEKMLLEELDLTREAAYMELFRKFSKEEPSLYVPKVFWELSGKTVLVTEFLIGKKLTELQELTPEEREKLAEKFVHVVHRTIFELGTFHGDLHPGNIFLLPDGRLGFVDFGIVGRLLPETLYEFFLFSFGVMNKDPNIIIHSLKRIKAVPKNIDENQLKREIVQFLDKYYNQPLSRIDAEKLFYEELSTARKFKIVLPEELVILMKTIAHTESIARLLYPDFRLPPLLKPYLKRIAPKIILREMKRRTYLHGQAYLELLESLPELIKEKKEKDKSDYFWETATLGFAVTLAFSPKLLPVYLIGILLFKRLKDD